MYRYLKPLCTGIKPLCTGTKPLCTGTKPLCTGLKPLCTGIISLCKPKYSCLLVDKSTATFFYVVIIRIVVIIRTDVTYCIPMFMKIRLRQIIRISI
jgi:hypothetical protein